jgi:uncharacterized protein (DUF697 family)
MNQTALLHIVERLERLVTRLPEKIRRPVLRELTPLKELFLQQRPPRFLFVGSSRTPTHEIINTLFSPGAQEEVNIALMPVHRWVDWNVSGHGTISVLDARDVDQSGAAQVEGDLKRQRADIIFLFDEAESNLGKPRFGNSANLLLHLQQGSSEELGDAKVIGVSFGSQTTSAELREAVKTQPGIRDRLLKVIEFTEIDSAESRGLLSVLTEELPNQAKIEMIRISRDREAQHHVAQMLIKSTTAICTAIGAQPIPLADLPILTSLQVAMVSGIMYISGRERSLRAATEFIAALGANVGVGMLLREGARAVLKFFPGWGNVVCGMVAGAGTYAIGRAASAFFIGGVSLKDARQKYLADRKKASHKLPWPNDSAKVSRSVE